MQPQRLDHFLRGLPDALAQRVRQLVSLQKAYREISPPALASVTRVGAYSQGRLTLFADSGAVAAKLKHVTPVLLLELQKRGLEVNLIEVRVQVSGSPRRLAKPDKNHRKISAQALDSVAQLADRLAPSPLREALQDLLAAQRRKTSRTRRKV
ncbi:MAG TPA: DUF721 domain-containing protein [Burkholderiales bacterium]|nr:DUF721 domain-containing protein [Burkholderiales bacterium]